MYWVVKFLSQMVMLLPNGVALGLGRLFGWVGYYLGPAKKRHTAYRNLRIAFGGIVSDKEIRGILRANYQRLGQNIIEVLRLPIYAREGVRKKVTVVGEENLNAALARNKGVIFLSMHSGNWELSSLVGSMRGHPYNLVANPLSTMGPIEKLFNEYRQFAGCKIVNPGFGMREVIRCLKANEIVSLVADQGGKDGALVSFFGRPASMSTGAIRLARKYGASICLVDISRKQDGTHCLTVDPPLELAETGAGEEKDVLFNLQRVIDRFEQLVRKHPTEYMWFYKVWKYSSMKDVLILDDGRTGHLRQSQALAKILQEELAEKGKHVLLHTVALTYRS
ncbi:MAG: lysophospholipid acyltransferase family protein, partial [Candidatus Omnitrophica bacterium]|nr:lysophospholipid acyltransferase family protein [Candidatus Omnitrophota bacterium]